MIRQMIDSDSAPAPEAVSFADDADGSSFESYFRDPAFAAESPLAWRLGQRLAVLDALRGLLSGGQAMAQLRLWVFLELATLPRGRLQRDDLNQAFFSLRPEALDASLKRLRDLGLLIWDATAQDYHLSPLAQQLQGLLAPLARTTDEDDEMAALLAQVAGAQALGLSDAGQIQHLHAQLARRYDEFADVIASGSEARLREAQPRFERALQLVERAGEALTALIRSDHDDPRLEREARALGHGQARLLSMASQFTRALQQADRQRVTLGTTGITSSDVRDWLQSRGSLHELLGDALSFNPQPVFISGHELVDVAEGEFERDRPDPQRSQGLPPAAHAASGTLEALRMPQELGDLIDQLAGWTAATTPGEAPAARPIDQVVLGGRYAQAAYRLQLLPLLGDEQARTLQGLTGDLARSPWRTVLLPETVAVQNPYVAALSAGRLEPDIPDDPHA
ncbi:hypothetical protein [Castellaniella sp.]|uniref:hypothetical protein n=1 Tax=Castellaniella sp. TaxID=1955812 RepID=UPI003C732960